MRKYQIIHTCDMYSFFLRQESISLFQRFKNKILTPIVALSRPIFNSWRGVQKRALSVFFFKLFAKKQLLIAFCPMCDTKNLDLNSFGKS